MEQSVVSTIEKIKLQEQDKEVKLKEKREHEANVVGITRAIRDITTSTTKLKQDCKEIQKRLDCLEAQRQIAKIRKNALCQQLEASLKKLNEVTIQCDQGIMEVWEQRSKLCEAVQSTSDEYDIRTLLMKPAVTAEPLKKLVEVKTEVTEPIVNYEGRMKQALERREAAFKMKQRLMMEPEIGDEFVRRLPHLQNFKRFNSKYDPSENEPIKFTSSAAATRVIRPILNPTSPKDDAPWYQPYSVIFSVAIFMIYFCILREESDIDSEFSRTLYERIKGLEKHQLLLTYKYNKENGLSVAEIEQRLKEIESEEDNEKS